MNTKKVSNINVHTSSSSNVTDNLSIWDLGMILYKFFIVSPCNYIKETIYIDITNFQLIDYAMCIYYLFIVCLFLRFLYLLKKEYHFQRILTHEHVN
jgi:hypothetical protein